MPSGARNASKRATLRSRTKAQAIPATADPRHTATNPCSTVSNTLSNAKLSGRAMSRQSARNPARRIEAQSEEH